MIGELHILALLTKCLSVENGLRWSLLQPSTSSIFAACDTRKLKILYPLRHHFGTRGKDRNQEVEIRGFVKRDFIIIFFLEWK